MSYIAASGARSLAQAFQEDSFDPFDAAQKGMAANASNYSERERNKALQEYYTEIGESKVKGYEKLGSANSAANQNAFMGSMFELAGEAGSGLIGHGIKKWGWGPQNS